MILDQQSTVIAEGMVEFPTFVFSNQPLQPSNVKENPQAVGQSTNATAIQGTVGTPQAGPSIIFPVS